MNGYDFVLLRMLAMNDFFRILFSNPGLLWKAGAGFIFIGLAAFIFFEPGLTVGGDKSTANIFAALLGAYGLYRFATFYFDYKNIRDGR